MPITRSKKEEVVAYVGKTIEKSKVLIFAQFHGLSVSKNTALRKLFRGVDAEYAVVKKSLLKLAFRNAGKEIPEELEGEVALIAGFGEELPPFKVAGDFAKKEKGLFRVLGGFFEGKYVDEGTAKALGAIPSREALIAQLMGVIQGNTRKLLYVIDQMSKKS